MQGQFLRMHKVKVNVLVSRIFMTQHIQKGEETDVGHMR